MTQSSNSAGAVLLQEVTSILKEESFIAAATVIGTLLSAVRRYALARGWEHIYRAGLLRMIYPELSSIIETMEPQSSK